MFYSFGCFSVPLTVWDRWKPAPARILEVSNIDIHCVSKMLSRDDSHNLNFHIFIPFRTLTISILIFQSLLAPDGNVHRGASPVSVMNASIGHVILPTISLCSKEWTLSSNTLPLTPPLLTFSSSTVIMSMPKYWFSSKILRTQRPCLSCLGESHWCNACTFNLNKSSNIVLKYRVIQLTPPETLVFVCDRKRI